jgi:hypothetical protein
MPPRNNLLTKGNLASTYLAVWEDNWDTEDVKMRFLQPGDKGQNDRRSMFANAAASMTGSISSIA